MCAEKKLQLENIYIYSSKSMKSKISHSNNVHDMKKHKQSFLGNKRTQTPSTLPPRAWGNLCCSSTIALKKLNTYNITARKQFPHVFLLLVNPKTMLLIEKKLVHI